MSSDGEYLEPVTMYEESPAQLNYDEMMNRLQYHDRVPIPEQDIFNVSARYLNQLPKSVPIESTRVVRRPHNCSIIERE